MQGETPGGGTVTVLLHVFPSFSFGGQQARLAMLARGLGPSFRHVVVSLDGDLGACALFDETVSATFESVALKKSSSVSPVNIWRLARLIRRVKPDILCTYNWGAIEAVVARKFTPRIPHIHFEDGFGPDETIERQHERRIKARRLLLRNTLVAVPSRTLENAAREAWRLKCVRRLENGVDFDSLQRGRRGAGAAMIVGSVGALRPEKNYGRLIAAFRAADKDARARLEIVGAGPELEALRKAASGDPRISLPGPTAQVADIYAHFDIFALSSDTEQAPISMMEAMAAGLPVVATNVGDIADMTSTENLPFITPPGDDEAYACALARMLQDPSSRAAIGAANRRKAREAFSRERMIEAYRRLFDEARGRNG